GTVTATGAGNGAGIGGGGGGSGVGLDGAGGVSKLENDATVYASSGAGNAAGIGRGGGNNSSSTAATLTIDVTAVVFAYSTGTGKAAIDAVSTTSTSGYFVNAKIVAPEFPASADVDVYVFPDGLTDPTDLFCILTVPAGYCNFAYTTNAVSTQDDNLYALMDIIDIRQIVQNTVTEEREIPSRNDDVQLPVKFGISFTITVNVTMAGTGDPVEDAEIEFKVGDYPFTILTDPSGDCSMTLPEGLAFTFISVTKDSAHAKEAMPPAFVIDADDDFFFTMNVMYDVDVIGSNITSWTPTDTYHGQDDLEVTITADTGYHVSGITSVTMDGATLTEGSDYTVTDNVVTFLIDVEGDIVITAAAEPDEYDVDVIGSSVSSWTPDVAYHDQNDLVVTITPNTGYQIAGVSSVTMGSATLTEGTDFTVSDNVVTFLVDVDGDIVITVTTAPNDYIVDVIGSNVASWTPTGTYHGESGLTVTITMDAGYGIGAIPSVTMNTSPLTEGIGYTVSGNVVTFIDNVNGNVLIVVVAEPFEYTIDVIGSNVASWTPTDTYHGESDLIVTITADAGYRISGITSVTMDGAALTEGTDYTVADNVVTFLVSVNGDIVITAATEPSTYEVTVKVISDVGGSFEYTVTMGGTVIGEDEFTLGPGETYTIMDIPYGASVLITAIPDDGHKVVWNDNTPMRSEGLIFARGSITENINDLTVKFIPPSDDDVPVWSLLIVAFIGLIFLLIFLDDDEEEVYGKVTYNGKGLFAVKIGYTLNGGGRKEVMTDKDGDYSITVDKGDTVVITDVSKSRSSVSEGLPAEILIEKDRTKVDFKF
ncbi:MAG: hypothetical protein LBH69_04315, partial [Methanomassiliicoccaceae archaeon]|nr:hypothetical protein [Methanomassiliicoccaceae archaeon]